MGNIILTMLLSFSLCSNGMADTSRITDTSRISGVNSKQIKYIIVNAVEPTAQSFEEVIQILGPNNDEQHIRIGVGFIVSYFRTSRTETVQRLKNYLILSQKYNLPVVIQLDGEQWWQARPDLWNWWDKNQPGYSPENRKNVEWTSWDADSAVKIGWRNWGGQVRVLPMPNLMSPVYRKACHAELQQLVPIIVDWWKALPDDKKDLLVAVKVGWESAIGVNNWYYPNGNSLLDQSAEKDPQYGLTTNLLPDRGVRAIGYAAVSTLGLAHSGQLKEAYLTEVVRRHLEDLSKFLANNGLPRDKIFTHCGGWSSGESLYTAAINKYSCPGWSFYKYATDPKLDITAMHALGKSNAPYWGAVEWLLEGQKTKQDWISAISHTLADQHMRYMDIYNWRNVKNKPACIEAIRQITSN